MAQPEMTQESDLPTSNEGATILLAEAVPQEIPLAERKVDPKTIPWPEGDPKPWENNDVPLDLEK